MTETQRRLYGDFIRLLDRSAGSVAVLDVGTGNGVLARMFTEHGHRVTGCDIIPKLLACARQEAAAIGAPPHVLVSDAEALPHPDDAFDLVVSRHVFWTLLRPVRALKEWRRVTRHGGWVAVLDGQWQPPMQPARSDGHAPGSFERLLMVLPYRGNAPMHAVATVMRVAGLDEIHIEPLPDVLAAEVAHARADGRAIPVTHLYVVVGRKSG